MLVEYTLENGKKVIMDVPDSGSGVQRVSRPGTIAAQAKKTFEEALENVQPAAEAIMEKMQQLNNGPDEIMVEFGINMNAELGAVVAKSGLEASFKIAMIWTNRNKESRLREFRED